MNSLDLTNKTKVIVQGITGAYGSKHAEYMLNIGTNIVAGVVPKKGGQSIKLAGKNVPIFNTVQEAKMKFPDIKWSVLFVPAPFAKDAALEAIDSNLNIVIITEGIPVIDTLEIYNKAKSKGVIMIGPNCPGIAIVGQAKLGIIPNNILYNPGDVGIISRSGTLTYEMIDHLNHQNIGQHIIIGIGGDPLVGFDMIEALKLLNNDPKVKQIILIGEIGGNMEEEAAEYVKNNVKKEVHGMIVGVSAPKGKQMGHAGAIVSKGKGNAQSKIKAFKDAGIKIINLWDSFK